MSTAEYLLDTTKLTKLSADGGVYMTVACYIKNDPKM